MKNTSTVIIVSIVVLILLGMFLYKGNNKQDDKLINTNEITNISTDNSVENKNKNMDNNKIENYKEAILHTNMGDITFVFATDKPNTTSNFSCLNHEPLYNSVEFDSIIKSTSSQFNKI